MNISNNPVSIFVYITLFIYLCLSWIFIRHSILALYSLVYDITSTVFEMDSYELILLTIVLAYLFPQYY